MSGPVLVRRPRVGAWGFVLPAPWWTIPLADPVARRRAVEALIERQFGHADASAVLKREVRTELLATADRAAALGGRLLAVSLLQAGGAPISSTLIAYQLAATSVTGVGVRELEATMAPDRAEGISLDLGASEVGAVLRKVSVRPGSPDAPLERIPQLFAEYWLQPVDGDELLYLTFTTPLVQMRAAMVELFDAVVAAVAPTDD